MKTIKLLAFWFSFFMLTPFLASCDDDDNGGSDKDDNRDSALLGTWDGGAEGILTFYADGSFNWTDDGSGEFEYNEEKNLLILIYNDRDVETYYIHITNQSLTLISAEDLDENPYVFTRKDTETDSPSSTTSSLVGTWIHYYDDGDYDMYTFYADGTGMSGEYYADGTKPDIGPISYYYNESTNSLRYQEEDGDIFLYTAILNGDKLILMDEYGSETYVRQ